ncbi:hypothetical protein [Edaphobacter flagellatus]|uniref:hypothetical protein n=1 Tax=Edaphobacter flagellatus TaxID=1933044 RepID=UPI0021B497A9|nr:hypothetical protein [Edaphobacter flagellatus]
MFEEERIGVAARSAADGVGQAILLVHGRAGVEERVRELEVENLRLQHLVAELLLKNQRLRRVDQS